jgi:shikimate kinase
MEDAMKRLYIIGGTMGVGKTTVGQQLKKDLPNSVFLDGDWCWDADPFQVTEETKTLVQDNICHMLNNFLQCSVYETVIFCWVMHEQEIIDSIIAKLKLDNCEVKCISLIADEDNLQQRLTRDIQKGIRKEDVIARSIARIPLYQKLDTVKVDTNNKTIAEIVAEIAQL